MRETETQRERVSLFCLQALTWVDWWKLKISDLCQNTGADVSQVICLVGDLVHQYSLTQHCPGWVGFPWGLTGDPSLWQQTSPAQPWHRFQPETGQNILAILILSSLPSTTTTTIYIYKTIYKLHALIKSDTSETVPVATAKASRGGEGTEIK